MNRSNFHMPSNRHSWTGFRPLRVSAFALGVLGLALGFAPVAHGQGQGGGPVTPTAARVEQSALDQPLSLLHEGKRSYAGVRDYTCTLMSRERVRGELQDENIIQLKMKTQPFSIHMRWLAPKKNLGQEVAFVLGRNNNKMRVKSNHIGAKVVGFMSIDPNDPRVLEHSRHTIFEAGIGNMIEQTIKNWTVEREFDKTLVKINTDFMFNQRDCYRVEMTRTERNPNFYCYRSVMYLEKQSKLPIRMENYDWPRQGGPPEGDLLESFSYVNLQFNTGLRDEEFSK